MPEDRVVRLGDRRAAKKAKQQPREFPLRVNLVLIVDGQPQGTISTDVEMPVPAEGEAHQLNWTVDVRQLAQIIAPLVGPQQQQAPKLWTPGRGVIVRPKD